MEHIVDANTGFLRGPGQEVSTAEFATTPDEYTTLVLGAPFLHHLPDLTSSRRPITVEPRIALAHRLLLRSFEQTADALEMEAAILALVQCCLRRARPDRRIGRRITTPAARQRLVADVVEALHASFGEPSGLVDLGRMVGASPYHLSRVFREVTGTTISQYRTWLRVHAVLHRLDQGDHDLAGVAAATGFADHSHMTRTVSGYLGETPSILRQRLLASEHLASSPPRRNRRA